jgi:UDP-4-amino-4,6-dideoxy-N-acetyl-beta-L-altrosamine transaminase
MKDMIPYGKHYIDEDDIQAVSDILRNKSLTQGTAVDDFEKAVANYVGVDYAVAVSSWTSGLHISVLAAGVNKEHHVMTSPITFVSSANAALFCGAKPAFSDIDKETLNMCPGKLKASLKKYPSTKAIIPVHYAGVPCDMDSIKSIADECGATIIEDAAHALGARYEDGSMVGSCKYSDMTGFSFHPVKSIAAGEGGMITTNNKDIYKKLIRLRSHGINKLDDSLLNKSLSHTDGLKNPWYYEMQELGFNYRITDIQCALGESQLKKLPKFIERRVELVEQYDQAFSNIENIKSTQLRYRSQSSHHLYVIRIDYKSIKISRAKLMTQLRDNGIITQVHYIPVTSQPFYEKLGFNTNDFPEALNFYEEALSIPLYYSLSDQDQYKVIELIKKLIR